MYTYVCACMCVCFLNAEVTFAIIEYTSTYVAQIHQHIIIIICRYIYTYINISTYVHLCVYIYIYVNKNIYM